MAKTSEKKKIELEEAKRAAAEKVAREFPMHPADKYILQRYVFEPRCSYMGNQNWLVIKDRVTGKYIRKEENQRAYRPFVNSWDCVQYLRSKFVLKDGEAGAEAETIEGKTGSKAKSETERR